MFHVKQLEKQILPAKKLLESYMLLIKKWQKAVNLVSNTEINSLWERHILDSAQVFFEIPKEARILIDMGSGGGFPAVVIAILNKVLNGHLTKIVLIESDNKKSIFLKEVSRILDLNLIVLNERIERIKGISADVITARALASTDMLLEWGREFYKNDTIFLFLKGKLVDDELSLIPYSCNISKLNSKIDKDGCVLKITEVAYK